ncbi:MAG: hypothetical protein M1136_01330 [Chloroflexi bacterium]|nr:hypothetical protein [Chloroflexota bacterium]MCL5074281.1 hypothetical protein [Chloroflexota bacterium]
MEANKRKRLTIDLDPLLQRRLKVIAALKGISMRRYCLTAIEKELAQDESEEAKSLPFGEEALNRLSSLQAAVFGGRQVPGDSAELIREARAARAET